MKLFGTYLLNTNLKIYGTSNSWNDDFTWSIKPMQPLAKQYFSLKMAARMRCAIQVHNKPWVFCWSFISADIDSWFDVGLISVSWCEDVDCLNREYPNMFSKSFLTISLSSPIKQTLLEDKLLTFRVLNQCYIS